MENKTKSVKTKN